MIVYEYPLHERIRTYLRLERLFDRFRELSERESALDHHLALTTLFELLDVATRSDLKSDTLRDLDRQKQQLNAYRGNPAVAESMLEQTVQSVENCYGDLQRLNGKLGQALSENDWLTAIRSRLNIPGGTCEFDLPDYFAWQHFPPLERQQNLQEWIAQLLPLAESVKLLLSLMRGTGYSQRVTAIKGIFQQNLPQGKPFQFLRVRLHADAHLFPEISANRLVLSVRIMAHNGTAEPLASPEDTDFQLTLCA
ncbi:MAG: cell division protein ZapD [Brachymonas sp.]